MPTFPQPFPLRAVINNGVTSVLHGGGTGGGSILFSAGTLSALRSDITFDNGGGVTFGLDGAGIITASAAGGGAGTGFTTATTPGSNVVGTLGAGGLSMGIPAYLTTAQPPGAYLTTAQPPGAYLTTAMQSNASSDFAGTGFTSATTAGTNIVGTLATNGLRIGVPAYLTTAGTGGGLSAINVSAGSTSGNVSALTFSNGSGVSFGFDGSNITATVATNYQSPGAYLTTAMPYNAGSNFVQAGASLSGVGIAGAIASDLIELTVFTLAPNVGSGFTTGTTSGAVIVGTLSTQGLSMGVPAYLTTAQPPGAYLTTAMASNAGSNFAGTNGSIVGGSFTLNTSGATISLPAYLTTAQPPGAYLTTAALSGDTSKYAGLGFTSASTAGTAVVATLSTNGLSMGVPAYITVAAGGGGVALSNSQTLFSTGTVALSEGGGAITIASATAQKFLFSVPQTSLIVAAGAMTVSTSVSTISLSVPLLSVLVAGAGISISTAGNSIFIMTA